MRRIAALLAILGSIASTCAAAPAAAPASQIVSGVRIAAIAERAARALITDPERAVAPAFQIVDQAVPAGDVVIMAGVVQVNPTYLSIPIKLTVDGKVARTVYAGYRLTSYVRTAVAAHDLTPGTLLAEGDVVFARVPSNGRPAVDVTSLVGRKIRAAQARGALVYYEDTLVNELVKAGSPVLLIVHDGPVVLSADVVARNGGGLGDSVTVWNAQTQKTLSGIITAANVVEITLPGSN